MNDTFEKTQTRTCDHNEYDGKIKIYLLIFLIILSYFIIFLKAIFVNHA